MKPILVLFCFTITFGLISNPTFKRGLAKGLDNDKDGILDRESNCKTSDIYNGQTAVSFWGDSRIDLVDSPIYGNSSLDVYFGVEGWNVQNFGVSGRQSRGVNDEISECFKRETDYIASMKRGIDL